MMSNLYYIAVKFHLNPFSLCVKVEQTHVYNKQLLFAYIYGHVPAALENSSLSSLSPSTLPILQVSTFLNLVASSVHYLSIRQQRNNLYI